MCWIFSINRPERPPASPVAHASPEIWGLYRRQPKSFLISFGLQTAFVSALFLVASSPQVEPIVKHAATLVMPLQAPPDSQSKAPLHQGGGGGGDRSPLPASKGTLPKPALRQFVPPFAVPPASTPKLALEPSVLVPPDLKGPAINLSNFGDPLARLGPPSNGPGSGGGIGAGKGGGVGPGNGGGVGLGDSGGFGGGVYRVGEGGLTLPVPIFKPEPEYSEDARRARVSGEVLVRLVVDENGRTRDFRILRSLGLGLDEEALKAVAKWRFKPGLKDGKPVAVLADVYVGFHLL